MLGDISAGQIPSYLTPLVSPTFGFTRFGAPFEQLKHTADSGHGNSIFLFLLGDCSLSPKSTKVLGL